MKTEVEIRMKDPKEIRQVTLTDCLNGLDEFMAVVRFHAKLEFSTEFCQTVQASRALVERFLAENRAVYGVTTGFGENVRYAIPPEEAEQLQRNIVRSHACAVGQPLSEEKARAVMFMTILNAGKGHSGIRLETLELIRQMLNQNIIPYAPGEGSVGYLGVEAHLALAYIGEGTVLVDGQRKEAAEVLRAHGLEPLTLACKEGLTMLNGTISVTAIALIACYDSILAMQNAEIVGALCYEALRGTTKALDPRIHGAKDHAEQKNIAADMRKLLAGSEICERYRDEKVQDPILLRAMPQVEGAAFRLVKEAYTAILEELRSVSDNPEIFATEDGDGEALMCGNFDGTYVGTHVDMLSMAAAVVGTQAERCIARMVDRNLNDGLPAFLVAEPGLNNGFMIPQYTAAGLLNEIKLLAVPASIDSIPTCAGQEDPVSMAYNAATRSLEAVRKLNYILAIDILVALQALDLLAPLKQAPATAAIHDLVRKQVSFADRDRFFQPDIEAVCEMVKDGSLIQAAQACVGELQI